MSGKTTNDRAAGIAHAAASIAIIAGMAHHPRGVEHLGLARAVHGALMVLMIISFTGYLRFAARLGAERFVVGLGLSAYGVAVAGNMLAGTINGFVAPALSRRAARRR